jgi:hypothetical protein
VLLHAPRYYASFSAMNALIYTYPVSIDPALALSCILAKLTHLYRYKQYHDINILMCVYTRQGLASLAALDYKARPTIAHTVLQVDALTQKPCSTKEPKYQPDGKPKRSEDTKT